MSLIITTQTKKQTQVAISFEHNLNVLNSVIVGTIGQGANNINENFIFTKSTVIAEFFKQAQINNVLIAHNGNDFSFAFSSIINTVLNKKKIYSGILNNEIGSSKTIAKQFFLNEKKYDFFIYIEVLNVNKSKNIVKIYLLNSQLKMLTKEEENFINNIVINEIVYKKEDILDSKSITTNNDDLLFWFANKDLDWQKIENNYQFFDANYVSQLNNFFKEEQINIEKLLPIKKHFKQLTIIKQAKENSLIWRKIINSAQFKTKYVFWIKNNKIKIAHRKSLIFNIIKDDDIKFLVLDYIRNNFSKSTQFLISYESKPFFNNFVQKYFNGKIHYYSEYNQVAENSIYNIKQKNNDNLIIINQDGIFFSPKSNSEKIYFGLNTSFLLFWFVQILDYYSKNKQDIFDVIDKVKQESDFVYRYKTKMFISRNSFSNLLNELINSDDIKSFNFELDKQNLNNNYIIAKFFLEKGDYFKLLYSKEEEKLSITTFLKSANHSEKEAIFLENKIINKVKIVKKDTTISKKNTKKNVAKLAIFLTVIISIVFLLIYKFYNSSFQNGSPTGIFIKFYDYFFTPKIYRFYFIINLILFIIWMILMSVQIKRVLNYQGINPHFKHLFVATFISGFMQMSTPFAFGGEISYYWYLQRKGYPLKNISATLTYNALVHQIFNLLISILFISLGFYFYRDLFNLDSTEKIIFFIWLIANIFLNIFVLLIIIVIGIWKKLQYWLIRNFVWLLHLNIWKKIEDSKRVEYNIQFFIDNFKNQFIEVLANKSLLFEVLLVYKLPLFLVSSSFATLVLTLQKANYNINDLSIIDYIKFLSGNTILAMSNNLSPAPGGVGSVDIITQLVFKSYFRQDDNLNLTIFNFANRFYTWFLPYIISAFGIITVWIGEKRIDKYKEIRKTLELNSSLKSQITKSSTKFYKYAILFWSVIVIVFFLFILLH
ncbi:flippase-like domain-containing protein [Mesomycoplasma conjunctivae]|uniref:lysylphosphatidylglycerol synthase transmembrane domain-containing protein n=1 Tax=Mesomycoplasma conjunctivae TaxID=45361 RepID=UPI003DA36AC1